MITLDTARKCGDLLSRVHACTVVEPDERDSWLARARAAVSLIPGAAAVLDQVLPLVDAAAGDVARRVSVTIPLPLPIPAGRSLIILSPAAVADGVSYLSTLAHELVHDRQSDQTTALQAAVDYANPELRALREAEAGGVGLWVRYLLTGERPAPEDAGVVRSGLYHLGGDDRAFGREVVSSLLASIDTGAIPPHSIAREVLSWLQTHAPADIAVEALRAPRVPQ